MVASLLTFSSMSLLNRITSFVFCKKNFTILFTILIFFFRFIGSYSRPLNNDEAFQWLFTDDFYKSLTIFMNDTHPPVFHLLSYFWVKLFGDGLTSLRLFANILGVSAFPIFYSKFKKKFDQRSFILVLILLGCHPLLYNYGTMFRSYCLLATGTLLLFSGLEEFVTEEKRKGLFTLILSLLCLPLSHYIGVVFWYTTILSYGLLNRKRLKRLILPILLGIPVVGLCLMSKMSCVNCMSILKKGHPLFGMSRFVIAESLGGGSLKDPLFVGFFVLVLIILILEAVRRRGAFIKDFYFVVYLFFFMAFLMISEIYLSFTFSRYLIPAVVAFCIWLGHKSSKYSSVLISILIVLWMGKWGDEPLLNSDEVNIYLKNGPQKIISCDSQFDVFHAYLNHKHATNKGVLDFSTPARYVSLEKLCSPLNIGEVGYFISSRIEEPIPSEYTKISEWDLYRKKMYLLKRVR